MSTYICRILSVMFLGIALSACGQASPEKQTPAYVPKEPVAEESASKKSVVTFYLVSELEKPGARSFGCGEYLIKITKPVSGNRTVARALKALFEADPASYGSDLSTATAIHDGYFILESVVPEIAGAGTTTVSLRRREGVGLTGVCDTPRFKEQITETVRAQAGTSPFIIKLNGSEREWRCLGDESGLCI